MENKMDMKCAGDLLEEVSWLLIIHSTSDTLHQYWKL